MRSREEVSGGDNTSAIIINILLCGAVGAVAAALRCYQQPVDVTTTSECEPPHYDDSVWSVVKNE